MKVKDIYAKHGLLIQQKPFTCGPSTLQNVLKVKGIESYSEDDLTEMCEAKPGIGTANTMMVKVAKKAGLHVIETKAGAKLTDIEKHIDAGDYVIVCYLNAFSGNGHYGFITEHDDLAYYLRDCDHGLFRLEKKEFDKFWYGQEEGSERWFMAIQ